MNQSLRLLVFAVFAICFTGCNEPPAAAPETQEQPKAEVQGPVLKITMQRTGKVVIDGAVVSPTALREKLKKLAAEKGTIWYYREEAQGDGPPEALEVTQAFIDARLPIRFSSKPDFSDEVGLDGMPVPARSAK